MILGHQVVGKVVARGAERTRIEVGARVGVALDPLRLRQGAARASPATGTCAPTSSPPDRDVNGGYAQQMVVQERFAHRSRRR